MRKPKRRIGVAIDMTPMVDVAFLLLIFFMTTTTFKPPDEVVIQLPVSHAEYKVPDTDVLIITITKDGQIFSQVGTHDPMTRLDASHVGQVVAQERRKSGNRVRVVVKADRGAPYGMMEDLMNTLQEVGATRFVLMTEGEEGAPEGGGKELPTDEELERKRQGGAGDLGALFGDSEAGEVMIASSAESEPVHLAGGARVDAPREGRAATWAQ